MSGAHLRDIASRGGFRGQAQRLRRGSALFRGRPPFQDLETSIVMLRDRRATLHEIAGVDIELAVDGLDRRVMDMAADHAVDAAPRRFRRERLLEIADEIDGVLDLQLRPCREGPVADAEQAARSIELVLRKIAQS